MFLPPPEHNEKESAFKNQTEENVATHNLLKITRGE